MLAQIIYSHQVIANQFDKSNPEPSSGITQSQESLSKKFMIVTADKRASLAAREILLAGGNAIDAAIAAQNVLSVVEPQSSGLGGGGFLLFFNNIDKKIYAYDGRETSSSLVKDDMYLINNNKIQFIEAVQKPFSVGVPGLYSMLADAHNKFGALKWEKLFISAIQYSEGFQIEERLNKLLNWAPHIKKDKFVNDTYFYKGEAKKKGTMIKNLDLKKSLKILSKNPYSINKGMLAKKISEKLDNKLPLNDLRKWETIEREPLCKEINSYKICGFPPPTSGGIGLIQIISILNNKKNLINNKDFHLSKHLFIEASRLAYQDRKLYIADPLFFDVPTKELISDKYLKLRSDLINKNKSIPNFKPGNLKNIKDKKIIIGKNFEKKSTTHISIVDKNGNAVALTSSIEFAFGSGITAGGFFLNNQITDFSFFNKAPEGHLIANRVEPNKRPRSSMSPTFIFFKNELIGILGSPGGSRIICYVSKVAFEILFLKNDPLSAVNSPHYCSRDNFTELENNNISSDLRQYLQEKNHDIKYKDMTSGLNIIWRKNQFWQGIADPRREGFAIGY